MLPARPILPIATLGSLSTGAVQVNINPMYTPTELKLQLDDSGAETLVVFSGASASFAKNRSQSKIKRLIVVNLSDGTESDLDSPRLYQIERQTSPFSRACVQPGLRSGRGQSER